MKKILLIFLLFFSGCSIKEVLNSDPLYQKTLMHTQRAQIINSFETKALIDGVYLNPLYNELKNPTFLIGIYNDFDNSLINKEFNLTLNSQAPIKISKEISNFPYKKFPFYNEWMSYYLVEFNNTKKPFVLTYKSKHWGEVNLTF